MNPSLDLHHMTAIVGDAQANVDFYTQTLGLRMIKLTVNFDDPTAYHLYYGDHFGTPGTVLTFFPYPGRPAQPGPGQVVVTKLAVPEGSLKFWEERLGNAVSSEAGLRFEDPDGLVYDLVETNTPAPGEPWTKDIPIEYAIKGMAGVVIQDGSKNQETAMVVQDILGYRPAGETFRSDSTRTQIEIIPASGVRSHGGIGSVHHIAFRLPDDETQARYRQDLVEQGLHVSPIMDRDYFHSIYFREPGGVLFELATDHPGFMIDEEEANLAGGLHLPKMYEPLRRDIERALPTLRLPNGTTVSL